jgi:hypothetical protein
VLAQAPPLDFPVHLHQHGDYVLIKTWKENKLKPAWEGHFLVLLTMGNSHPELGEEEYSLHMGKEDTPPTHDQKEQWTPE